MKKRICFLVDTIFSIGGVQRVTAVIAKELAKEADVTMVTFDDPDAKDPTLYQLGESNIRYRFFHYPTTSYWKDRCCKAYSLLYRKVLPQTRLTSDLYMHSSFPSELRQKLTEELLAGHYDVIIGVHAPLAVRLAACQQQLGKTRCIGWLHNSYEALFGEGSSYAGPELRRHYEFQLEKLHSVVVLSKHDAARYPFPTRVIYNPLTLIPGKTSTGTSRKFLAVGRFSHRHKGFDLLIEAFHRFAAQNKEWTLDIVGEGVEEPMYRTLIKQYGLAQRITIHPFTSDIQSYYSEAQVYVLSSRWEGMPLVLVEAMSHGLPVVASDLPICQEIMGDSALYFRQGDAEDLASRLQQATQADWTARSSEALQIASRYQVANMIEQWKQIIYEE
jgi:glycosyltransferase involved in cell wall biosynthesis